MVPDASILRNCDFSSALASHQLAERRSGSCRGLDAVPEPVEGVVVEDDSGGDERLVGDLAARFHEEEQRLLYGEILLEPELLGEALELLLGRCGDDGGDTYVAVAH